MAGALEETLRALRTLVEQQEEVVEGPDEGTNNFQCEHCVGCHDCRFCTSCTRCRECTYCHECRDCVSLTQCRECIACDGTSHSDWSAHCTGGSYCTLCIDCEDCVQCFACVGLSGEEFCILNEKLPRKEYFAKVRELRAELDELARTGWRPPWDEDEASRELEQAQEEEREATKDDAPPPEPPAMQATAAASTAPVTPAAQPTPAVQAERAHPAAPTAQAAPSARAAPAAQPPPATAPAATTSTPAEPPGPSAEDSGAYARRRFGDHGDDLEQEPDSPRRANRPGDAPPAAPEAAPSSAKAAEGDTDGPTRLYASFDDQPTLTRGNRPVARSRPDPHPPGPRVTLRRAKRPKRG